MVAWDGTLTTTPHGGLLGARVRVGDLVLFAGVDVNMKGANGDPDATFTFEVVDGRPQCTNARVWASDGGRGVRTADLRSANLDGMITNAFLRGALIQVGENPDGTVEFRTVEDEREFWQAIDGITTATTRPRRDISRALLRQVAEEYLANVDGNPVQAVMAKFGMKERTAQRRIKAAEEEELLPRTTPGRKRGTQ